MPVRVFRTGRGQPAFGRSSRVPPKSMMGGRRRSGGSFKIRLLIAAAIAIFALISYFGNPGDVNQITGERERVALVEEEDEAALGLRARDEMVRMHGGPSRDLGAQQMVQRIGNELIAALEQEIAQQDRHNPYTFQFTLLADPQTVNAFALPGGQVFITEALFERLETEGQLAGVLGHEIGHVIARHGNQRMAKDQLLQGLAAAGGIAAGDNQSAQLAQMVAQMVSMKYGREDELESDQWGVRLTALAGYDPRAMFGLMQVLEEAGGGGGPPEFMSTHPKPANRVEYIEQVIAREFPGGVPEGLQP